MRLPAHRPDPGVRYVATSFVVGIFFPAVAGGITFPALPRLELVLGISPTVVGVVLSTTGAVRLLSNAPVGSLLDQVGTRRPLIAGVLLLSVAPFGYALGLEPGAVPLGPAAVFITARAGAGVGSALVLVGGYAMITDITTLDNRGRWIGYMLGAYGLGFPAGLVVGGLVADVYDIRTAFLLAGAVSLVSIPIILAFVPDRAPSVEQGGGLREIPGLVRADRRLAVLGTVNGILSFLSRAFLTTVVVFAAKFGLELGGLGDMGVTGVMLALVTLSASGAMLVAGRFSDTTDGRLFLVLPSLCVMALGFLTVALVPTLAGILGGGVVAALGGGAAAPVLKAYLGDISPPGDVAKLGGAYDGLGDLGGILAPVLALPAASSMGFETLYLGCAGLGVTAAILVAGTLLSVGTTPGSTVAE
ncbi:MFS transporter [Halorarius litoreus]|uniref:MFS transporter n=1 Tax=Halorarius litoreus TaxID=2962676 RepID=UPI0020CEB140|nr:MFS transporter [Halorarius litoreus]